MPQAHILWLIIMITKNNNDIVRWLVKDDELKILYYLEYNVLFIL